MKKIKIYIVTCVSKCSVVGVWTSLTKLTRNLNNEKSSYHKIYHKIKDLSDDDLLSFVYVFEHFGETHQIEIRFLNS